MSNAFFLIFRAIIGVYLITIASASPSLELDETVQCVPLRKFVRGMLEFLPGYDPGTQALRAIEALPDNEKKRRLQAYYSRARNKYYFRMLISLGTSGWGVHTYLNDPYAAFPFMMMPSIDVPQAAAHATLVPRLLDLVRRDDAFPTDERSVSISLSASRSIREDKEQDRIEGRYPTYYRPLHLWQLGMFCFFLWHSVNYDRPFYVGAFAFQIFFNLVYVQLFNLWDQSEYNDMLDCLNPRRTPRGIIAMGEPITPSIEDTHSSEKSDMAEV